MIKFCSKCGQPHKDDKCIVKGCENHRYEGNFIGDLCVPCNTMITSGKIGPGATWIHKLELKSIRLKIIIKDIKSLCKAK